ncbi:MAG: hypothetical protein PX481_18700 [Microcystis sp. M53603_WE2]|jgi:hypothetical protein|uniref:hypothetical protein n=1 Tax=unclassified Microcystis TaxID=2643300 RepID=UPI0022CCAD4E|nr:MULTISPECIES: hypothetical protein [unclassified Microcystis]MCZ8362822.1 hypothetical protein [Microcystis sp. LE19-251.1A]MDJ0527016.1 hypothetical protein [Microcystis sp. M53600_WE12]MDJ0543640.1 hypothetical protein [Microcystis sp. M53601_WE4]MCZ8025501.1 hypothetical protein [Microcystis sp. LE19-10.1B]MDJ0540662.1 hypothetical protein [Microcystis sp. M53603_WE2]
MTKTAYNQGCLFGKTLTLSDSDWENLTELSKAVSGDWERVLVHDLANILPKKYQESVSIEASKYSSYSGFIVGVLDALVS